MQKRKSRKCAIQRPGLFRLGYRRLWAREGVTTGLLTIQTDRGTAVGFVYIHHSDRNFRLKLDRLLALGESLNRQEKRQSRKGEKS
jgi:hypothetical protein